MFSRNTSRKGIVAFVLALSACGAAAIAQSGDQGVRGFLGDKYAPRPDPADAQTRARKSFIADTNSNRRQRPRPMPVDARSRLVHWNGIAVDATGLDHTPVEEGEDRVYGEQLGPGRASRAMAIVHIAIFDAVNAIYDRWDSYTDLNTAAPGASVDAAIAQAAHDTLAHLFPSQATALGAKLNEDLARITGPGVEAGRRAGHRAAAAIIVLRKGDGAEKAEPRMDSQFIPSEAPGKWRQDPISQIPIALGAYWGDVTPFVIQSGNQFRVAPPPAMTSPEYAAAFDEVKRFGGDSITTPTDRTPDQTHMGIYWAYDGMPSLCAPPRLYNQIAMTIADQMGSDFFELTRLLALIHVSMADAGIAIWESKFHYQVWRPVTGIREADFGTGPTGLGDGNADTIGNPTFEPFGAPASNLSGPDFTPPFPSYPSGHAGFGGALFEVLRGFYGRDDIAFTFVSDEYNGTTLGHDGKPRPLKPRSFTSLSQAEEENGQSRIYLGIHWSFDKTEGIAQGRRVAQAVLRRAFGERK